VGKVAADHKPVTKLIQVKTSTASVCTTQTLRLLTLDARLKLQFLNDPSHELEQLRKYQSVCQVQHQCSIISSYRKTVQPSWTHADTSRRNKLSDESFETLLLLKKNKKFA